MDMKHQQWLEDYEHENRRKSMLLTAGISIVLLVLGYFWVVMSSTTPPPDEKEYEVVGAIDFGDMREGRKSVNNRQEASADPSEAEPQTEETEAVPEEASEAASEASPEKIISTLKDAEVKTHKAEPTPDAAENDPAQTEPETDEKAGGKTDAETKTQAETKTDPTPKPKPKPQRKTNTDAMFSQSGGSNDGNNGDVGNRGVSHGALNGAGFAFGDGGAGDGGLQDRKLLKMVRPSYKAQEDGRFVIRVYIKPDGSVRGIKILKGYAGQIGIKRAVERALMQWKFSKIRGSHDQQVTVTFTFKLR